MDPLSDADVTRRSTEQAQLILGAFSLIVWFVITFWLIMSWNVADGPPPAIMTAGTLGLLVAALPWLFVRKLADELHQRKVQARGSHK